MNKVRHYLPALMLLAVITLSSGCALVPPVGSAKNPAPITGQAELINWPPRYEPARATFHISNSVLIDAPPETVWRHLIDAGRWAEWYDGASNVTLIDGQDGSINSGSTIQWKTMGLHFDSRIHEFEPPYRLGWESRRGLIQGYHTWLIVPTDGGSMVITEESQFGFLAYMQRFFQHRKLYRLHEDWLRELKVLSEARSTE